MYVMYGTSFERLQGINGFKVIVKLTFSNINY